jgi:hypothetical protein
MLRMDEPPSPQPTEYKQVKPRKPLTTCTICWKQGYRYIRRMGKHEYVYYKHYNELPIGWYHSDGVPSVPKYRTCYKSGRLYNSVEELIGKKEEETDVKAKKLELKTETAEKKEHEDIISVRKPRRTGPRRGGGRPKEPRMICTVCFKPNAVRYYVKKKLKRTGEMVRNMVYEHRDELPIKEFYYKGHRMFRYRRCNAGRVKSGLPFIDEDNSRKDYKKMYWDLLSELTNIVYGIDERTAVRIVKDIKGIIQKGEEISASARKEKFMLWGDG